LKIWIYFENWNEVYDCWHVYDNDIPVGTWKVVKSSNMKQQHKHRLQVGTLYLLNFYNISSRYNYKFFKCTWHTHTHTHTHMHACKCQKGFNRLNIPKELVASIKLMTGIFDRQVIQKTLVTSVRLMTRIFNRLAV
jgi:hypothetical protein